jgi:hypothetical protein
LAAGTKSVFGGFVHDLVEGGKDVVAELDLCDGCVADCCYADCESDDALFGEGGIEDSFHSILL